VRFLYREILGPLVVSHGPQPGRRGRSKGPALATRHSQPSQIMLLTYLTYKKLLIPRLTLNITNPPQKPATKGISLRLRRTIILLPRCLTSMTKRKLSFWISSTSMLRSTVPPPTLTMARRTRSSAGRTTAKVSGFYLPTKPISSASRISLHRGLV
jgi:hypothetical protein